MMMKTIRCACAAIACIAASVLLAACASPDTALTPSAPMSIAAQGSFFVGGRELYSDTLAPPPNKLNSGTVTVDQLYVHYQIPVNAKPLSLVLIHGCCLTGATWESTPDGRMGWDEFFVRSGFGTYVIDQAGRGRSAADISAINGVRSGKLAASKNTDVYAASHEVAWDVFRFGPAYPQLFAGMQFPIEAQAQFWKQMVPDWNGALGEPNPTVKDLSLLAAKLGNAVLVSHSESGIFPFQAASADLTGIKAIIAVEPGKCPDAQGDLSAFAQLPVLVVFGDYVADSPRWGPRMKACQAFVTAAARRNPNVQMLSLPAIGIHGNTHMMMQDKNNLQIAGLLNQWLATHVSLK